MNFRCQKECIVLLRSIALTAIYKCDSSNTCEYDCSRINEVDTCICARGYALNSDDTTCQGKFYFSCGSFV